MTVTRTIKVTVDEISFEVTICSLTIDETKVGDTTLVNNIMKFVATYAGSILEKLSHFGVIESMLEYLGAVE